MAMLQSQALRSLRKINCAAVSLLIVEDNEGSCRLMVELLRGAGFVNISTARNAEDAIEAVGAIHPDLLLVDWNLPGMSGIDLVTAIRAAVVTPDARFPNPQLPIVMITGRQRASDVAAARNAGINEFVVKPFSTASILRALARALVRKPRFVAASAYAGPDRRKRKASLFPGLLKRGDDVEAAAADRLSAMFREHLSVEMTGLRAFVAARGGLTRTALDHIVTRLLDAEKKALDFRLDLIAQATQSLNDYVRHFGQAAEADVLDVHLEALIRLNDVPASHRDEALSIVNHLHRLVARRRNGLKMAVRA